MTLTSWLSAGAVARDFAVREDALFRYARRGMVPTRWDETRACWLYELGRVEQLFPSRDALRSGAEGQSFGVLGELCLGRATEHTSALRDVSGAEPPRRAAARRAPARELTVPALPGARGSEAAA